MRSFVASRVLVCLSLILLFAPSVASAVITFTQLDDDVFIVSHRVKILGSRGKANKMVYTKAASLCVAAGFSHYKILDQESDAAQQYQAANASARVHFYLQDAEDRIGCERNADPKYVEQARKKLEKMNYEPPAPPEEAKEADEAEEENTKPPQ